MTVLLKWNDVGIQANMREKRDIALRDRREPGHFWADNEILDVFGDQLGHNGIGVYITLARFAYGSTVKLSLREIAAEARLGKDTVARALKVMADLGLVIERRAEKTRSVIQYDLANVKRLAAKVLKDRDQGSVVRDREEQGETVDHSGVRKADPPPSSKDDTRGGNLSHGETDGAVEDAARLSLGETDLSQTEVDFETDLSHRKGPCYRQDTRLKTQDNTPVVPTGVGTVGLKLGEDGLTDAEREKFEAICRWRRNEKRAEPGLEAFAAECAANRRLEAEVKRERDLAEWNKPAAVRARLPLVLVPYNGPVDGGPVSSTYVWAIDQAAAWVAKHRGITDKRIVRGVLTPALRGYADGHGFDVERAARLMLERFAMLDDAARSMKHAAWGPKTFIGQAHWLHPEAWPMETRRM